MTPAQAAQTWCEREFAGDWKAAWEKLKGRDGAPVPVRPPLPRSDRFCWILLAMGRDGILLGDDGLYIEIIPYQAVGLAPKACPAPGSRSCPWTPQGSCLP